MHAVQFKMVCTRYRGCRFNARCTSVVPDLASAPFYLVLQSKSVKCRTGDTFLLPRGMLLKKGRGNNGIFVNESL